MKAIEELMEKTMNEIDETLGVAGMSIEEMPETIMYADDYEIMRNSIAKAVISVVAPHYEKQIAKLKAELASKDALLVEVRKGFSVVCKIAFEDRERHKYTMDLAEKLMKKLNELDI